MSSHPVIMVRQPIQESAIPSKAYKAGYDAGKSVRNFLWGPASGNAINLTMKHGQITDQFKRTAVLFSAHAGTYLIKPAPDRRETAPYLVPTSFESPHRAAIFGFVYNDPNEKDGKEIGFSGLNFIRMERHRFTAGGDIIRLKRDPKEITSQLSGLAAG